MLTNERIAAIADKCDEGQEGNEFLAAFAYNIESEVTKPLLERIAELEADRDRLETYWYHALATQKKFEQALAAADNTLHHAIDVAQAKVAELEAKLAQRVPYTSKMGEAADKYINKIGGQSSSLPAQFRWEECLAAMLSAAPAAPGQKECKTPRACEFDGACLGLCKPTARAPNSQQDEAQ